MLSDLPPARNDLDKASATHLKIARKCIFFHEFCTFPVTEGNKIRHIYFQFTTQTRKLTHNTKFEHFLDAERHEFWKHHNSSSPWAREMPKSDPERHKFWKHHNYSHHLGPEKHQNLTQKDMNFGNAIILHYLGPENHQNPTQKDTNFEKLHSLTPAKKKCQQIRKVFIFPEFHTIIQMHSLIPSTLTNRSLLGTPSNTFSSIADQL